MLEKILAALKEGSVHISCVLDAKYLRLANVSCTCIRIIKTILKNI